MLIEFGPRSVSVYNSHLCWLCISTSFQVLHAPKNWLKHFFQPFSTSFVHFKPFSVISHLKLAKTILKWTIVSTSFRVPPAPKSWSKYKTYVCLQSLLGNKFVLLTSLISTSCTLIAGDQIFWISSIPTS